MTDLRSLEFSHNWNKKLDCDYFTTLRLSGRFQIGEWLIIFLKGGSKGRGQVIEKKQLKVEQLNTWICALDTGYTVEETKNILATMYPGRISDQTTIYLYLIRKETKKEIEERAQTEIFK